MLNRNNKIKLTDAGATSAADLLTETLQFYHIRHIDFAKRIGVSTKHLSNICHRKAFMSTAVALRIEQVTGLPANMLLQLDINYQLAHIEILATKAGQSDQYLQRYEWATS